MQMNVLIVGARGGFGGAVARELAGRGANSTLLVRPKSSVPDLPGARVVRGDVLCASDVEQAARGADVIVHAFNAPYSKWDPEAYKALENVIAAAVANSATILFPGNVYGLGPDYSQPLAEQCQRLAPTKKGELRNELERRLKTACQRGARAIILRAGDYFGPGAGNTWFAHMTEKANKGGAIVDPAPAGVPHEWAYLPDVAQAAVSLLERREALAAFEEFHFSGYAVDSAALMQAVRRGLGDEQRRVKAMAWWPLKVLSPVVPMLRELVEMRYLFLQPVLLDGSKLEATLGTVTKTPFEAAVAKTLGQQAAALAPRA